MSRTSLYAYEMEREQPKMLLPRRSISVPPPPPPPPPADSVPTTPQDLQRELAMAGTLIAMRARNDCDTENLDAQNKVQEELRQTLLIREKRRDLEILKTPQIYIEQSSTAKEVEEWLRGKGFSDAIVKKLHGLNGNELFALSNHTIESYFGFQDSRRLISQIILQKNVCGYKTTRSSELQAILARARKKADDSKGENFDEVF